MSSVSIAILENKKNEYQRKLNAARSDLKNYESSYESLIEFKGQVQSSQEAFNTISTRENQLLAAIKPYYDYNSCAKTFAKQITRFLGGFGTKIVDFSYSALIRMVNAQIRSTYNKIEELNDDILRYRDIIEDVESEIAYQNKLEVDA